MVKFKKIFIILLFLIGLMYNVVNGAEAEEITATSGAVIDCIDGKILYSKNMDEKLYPASLTKVLTAILVVENCNMQDEVVISQNAIDSVQSGYLTANIQAGEILTVEELLNLLLISSYNDVSNALAEHVGGSVENFCVMMNEKAKEIGCTNSNFVNSDGTHNENHYSTAHDLALIGKYAMQFDEIKNITDKISYSLRSTNKYEGTDRLYETTNDMLLSSSSNYYKYAKGIKTGFTTPAGNCLMVYSEKNDIPLVAVVLKSTTYSSKYEDARKILEYSYDNNTLRTIAVMGTNLQTIDVKGAKKDNKKLNAILEENIKAVVNVENKNTNIEPQIVMNDKIKAPIRKGDVVGKVSYEIEGRVYTSNLIAETNIEKSNTFIVFLLVFILILLLLGSLRTLEIKRRKQTLRRIRGK